MKALFGNDNEVLKALNTMMSKGMAGYRETVAKLESQQLCASASRRP